MHQMFRQLTAAFFSGMAYRVWEMGEVTAGDIAVTASDVIQKLKL